MSTREEQIKEYYDREYGPLVGATITGYDVRDRDDGSWTVLFVTTTSGELLQLEVSSDDEGNGPGTLYISEFGDGATDPCKHPEEEIDSDGYCSLCGEDASEDDDD